MPVSTRSNAISSAFRSRSSNVGDENQSRNPQVDRMRQKSTHPSVDLLDPANNSRSSKVPNISSADEDDCKLQENLPPLNHAATTNGRRVSGKHDWDLDLERLGFSCHKPARNAFTKVSATSVAKRRLTMGGVAQRENKENKKFGMEESKHGGGRGSDVRSRIMVYVRVRPMSKKEKDAKCSSCVRIVDRKDVYITEYASETDYLRLRRIRGRHFTFDAAFPETSTQDEVYSVTTAELVEGVLEGRNGSVFCYGATGAGKTYTMLGTVNNPGVMVLAIKDLFRKLRQRSEDGDHLVRLSYLEVYNESVRDLLSPGRPLVLRELKQGIVASGLTQFQAYSSDEVMAMLQQGNQNRTTEPTRMNETSSRSHAILQVVAEYKVREGFSVLSRQGKLSLIDLAGSERALATDLRTIRSLEGANINRSLLALSSCINALVEGKKHIPYRNSKLTQLLKDSLGGACHTVMIANISPNIQTFGETQNTLHWADRAKEIRTKTCVANEECLIPEGKGDQAKLLLEIQKENQQLRMQVLQYKQKIRALENQKISNSTAFPSSPMRSTSTPRTPVASDSQISEINNAKNLQYPTPDVSSYTRNMHGVSKTPNDIIQELKMKIRTLETDSENMNKDFAKKEERYKSVIANMQHEYTFLLKQKDDFMRQLCQNKLQANDAVQAIVTGEENIKSSILNEKTTPLQASRTMPARSAKLATEKSTKPLSQKPPRAKQVSRMDRQGRSSDTTNTELHDLRNLANSYRFQSPAVVTSGKKRTHDAITNGNSPISTRTRITRSQLASDAPSMLLQPGFARYRPSV